MTKLALFTALLLGSLAPASPPKPSYLPPTGTLRVEMTERTPLSLTLYAGDEEVLRLEDIRLQYGPDAYPTGRAQLSDIDEVGGSVTPQVATKRTEIPESYRQQTLTYRDGTEVDVRLYNDGLAYRLRNLPGRRADRGIIRRAAGSRPASCSSPRRKATTATTNGCICGARRPTLPIAWRACRCWRCCLRATTCSYRRVICMTFRDCGYAGRRRG